MCLSLTLFEVKHVASGQHLRSRRTEKKQEKKTVLQICWVAIALLWLEWTFPTSLNNSAMFSDHPPFHRLSPHWAGPPPVSPQVPSPATLLVWVKSLWVFEIFALRGAGGALCNPALAWELLQVSAARRSATLQIVRKGNSRSLFGDELWRIALIMRHYSLGGSFCVCLPVFLWEISNSSRLQIQSYCTYWLIFGGFLIYLHRNKGLCNLQAPSSTPFSESSKSPD